MCHVFPHSTLSSSTFHHDMPTINCILEICVISHALSSLCTQCLAARLQPADSQPAEKQKQGHTNMDLISKPRSKSIVWMYFGLKADEKGQPLNSGEAICRLCRKIVLAKGGNTTNLRSHLRRRHRADFFETASSTTSGALFETQGDLLPNSLLSLQVFYI